MLKKDIHQGVIIGYRNLLTERYQYSTIQAQYNLPPAFNEARIIQFRNYFLDYIYPMPEKRETLDAAFQNLDNYIKNPDKLLRLLVDSFGLVFKYGRHLPKILRAGLKALKSFRAASAIEGNLVKSAIQLSLEPPFSNETMKTLLSSLSQQNLSDFMDHNETLFETLYDNTLIQKILGIVEHLIAKMKKRPQTYSATEVEALIIGRDIIYYGNQLFDQLTKKEKQEVLEMTLKIEKDFIDQLFLII